MSQLKETNPKSNADNPMTAVISSLLVIGVVVSAVVLAIGVLLLAITGQTGYNEPLTPQLLLAPQGSVIFPRTIAGVAQGVLSLKPFAVIELGALLLIATPVLRVAVSVLVFLYEGDRLYVAITLLVLFLLLLSIFWIR
ncbi:MAG: DUF1634 domain-containing protein [Chloroflexi bacterium]|nr:DUF1634 domain-containing protein [Chloroflexota bacterium]